MMLSQLLKMGISLNGWWVALLISVGIGLIAASLQSLLDAPMLTTVQLGPWYGSFLPFH